MTSSYPNLPEISALDKNRVPLLINYFGLASSVNFVEPSDTACFVESRDPAYFVESRDPAYFVGSAESTYIKIRSIKLI